MFDGVEQVEVGDALASQFDLESRAGAKEILDATEQIGSWLRTLGDVAVVVSAIVIAFDLEAVDADAGAGERMPNVVLPIVGAVEADTPVAHLERFVI
jgi:hypothetical protein